MKIVFFLFFLFYFGKIDLCAQNLSNVRFPLLLKEIKLVSEEVPAYDEYVIDSCLIQHEDTIGYFKYLKSNLFSKKNCIAIDSTIHILAPFDFIDTILINEKLYVALNPYSNTFRYEEQYNEDTDIIDIVAIKSTIFSIINKKIVYAKFELTDENIYEFFFTDKVTNYIDLMGW